MKGIVWFLDVHFALIIGSAVVTITLVPLVRRLALAVGAVDNPAEKRRIHTEPIPRLGGIAIFLPAIVILAGHYYTSHGGLDVAGPKLLGLLLATAMVFALGVYDDIYGAKASMKLCVQAAAASFLYFAGVSVNLIATPFGGMSTTGFYGFLVTILWVVGLTNGMNLIDGIDGVAAGVGAMGMFTVALISFWQGTSETALIAGALCGSLVGFLAFNFHPASIFLGDSGALTLGFLLAALPILGHGKSATAVALLVPIIALGIPIFDTAFAMVRRQVRGRRLFEADREHLHHRLLDLGLSQRQVALTLYSVSIVLTVLAIVMTQASRAGALMILFALGAATVIAVRRLGMDEVQAIWGRLRHGERRRRPPRYGALLVQNSLPLLERCQTGAEMKDLLNEIRGGLEFDTLTVRFKDDVHHLPLNGAAEISLEAPFPESAHENSRRGSLRQTISGDGGESLWVGTAEIICEMRNGHRGSRNHECELNYQCELRSDACDNGKGHVVGELIVTKPSWKCRRVSDARNELLHLLAEGIGRWFAGRLRIYHGSAGRGVAVAPLQSPNAQ